MLAALRPFSVYCVRNSVFRPFTGIHRSWEYEDFEVGPVAWLGKVLLAQGDRQMPGLQSKIHHHLPQ